MGESWELLPISLTMDVWKNRDHQFPTSSTNSQQWNIETFFIRIKQFPVQISFLLYLFLINIIYLLQVLTGISGKRIFSSSWEIGLSNGISSMPHCHMIILKNGSNATKKIDVWWNLYFILTLAIWNSTKVQYDVRVIHSCYYLT
jgi:hypothetical protein